MYTLTLECGMFFKTINPRYWKAEVLILTIYYYTRTRFY